MQNGVITPNADFSALAHHLQFYTQPNSRGRKSALGLNPHFNRLDVIFTTNERANLKRSK